MLQELNPSEKGKRQLSAGKKVRSQLTTSGQGRRKHLKVGGAGFEGHLKIKEKMAMKRASKTNVSPKKFSRHAKNFSLDITFFLKMKKFFQTYQIFLPIYHIYVRKLKKFSRHNIISSFQN